MASFASRTGQKIKEWWGAKVTVDPQMEAKKQRINEIDQYVKGLTQSFSNIGALFQQMHGHFGRICSITQKLYEKETDTNKRIGIEVTSMFGNISELYRSKFEPINELNKNFGEWFQIIETLKVQMSNFSDYRLVYDHYKLKVDELEKERSSLIQKGQPEDFKLADRLRRNVSKLTSSETNYKQRLSEILNNMNKLLGTYYKMFNTSLDSFININQDLHSNAKSIVKKNLKAFNKFKYPELEPIIDLLKEQKEMSSILEKEVLKEKEKEKEKDKDKEKEKEKEKEKDDKPPQQQQQPPPPQQTPQWEQNSSRFNPFAQQMQQPNMNPMMSSSFQMNQQPQMMPMNPMLSQRPSMQQFNNTGFVPQQQRVMTDFFDDPWSQQKPQYQSQIISPTNFQTNNPFQSQAPMSNRMSMPQQPGMFDNPYMNNRVPQANPFETDVDFQRRAMYDNPHTYNQQLQDANKTNPFL